MGSFHKDIKRGAIGEKVVLDFLEKECPELVFKKRPGKFKDWDIEEVRKDGKQGVTIEVKYDEMSEKSGNICVEVSNGSELTGIYASKAEAVYYVIPHGKKFDIYIFHREDFLKYIKDNPGKFRAVQGGDNWKFSLLLIKQSEILKDIDQIGRKLTWDMPQD